MYSISERASHAVDVIFKPCKLPNVQFQNIVRFLCLYHYFSCFNCNMGNQCPVKFRKAFSMQKCQVVLHRIHMFCWFSTHLSVYLGRVYVWHWDNHESCFKSFYLQVHINDKCTQMCKYKKLKKIYSTHRLIYAELHRVIHSKLLICLTDEIVEGHTWCSQHQWGGG